jgi:hypothetical protein
MKNAVGRGYRPDGRVDVNVHSGSRADISQHNRYVRFTPDSGHSALGLKCPIRAKSGHHRAIKGTLRFRRQISRQSSIYRPQHATIHRSQP